MSNALMKVRAEYNTLLLNEFYKRISINRTTRLFFVN
jgi:hypothetical protein